MAHGGVPMPKTITEQAYRSRSNIKQPGGSVPLGNRMLGTAEDESRRHTSVVGVSTTGLAAPVW